MDQYEAGSTDSRLEFDDPEHHQMNEDAGGGTAKLLTMFFGAAVVCALFFGLGYKMGRSSASDAASALVQEPKPVTSTTAKPSAMSQPPEVEEATPEVAPEIQPAPATTKPTASAKPVSTAAVQPAHAAGNFAVQVAAVTREEDADALVTALRNKSYPVFVVGNQGGDKFFHVQVGPFPTLADAEAMRSRLAADGYNPILKK
jgi:cell division septation protein DedD